MSRGGKRARLTKSQINNVIMLSDAGYSGKQISEILNISTPSISRIRNTAINIKPYKATRNSIDEEEINKFKRLKRLGKTLEEIIAIMDLSYSRLQRIIKLADEKAPIKEIIILFYEDYTNREISQKLICSINSVRHVISQHKKFLTKIRNYSWETPDEEDPIAFMIKTFQQELYGIDEDESNVYNQVS